MHKSILVSVVDKFGLEDRMEILSFLNAQKKIKIVETGVGSAVNLDTMDKGVYDKLVLLVEKIKNKKIDAVNLI
jgi:hypothetical protein